MIEQPLPKRIASLRLPPMETLSAVLELEGNALRRKDAPPGEFLLLADMPSGPAIELDGVLVDAGLVRLALANPDKDVPGQINASLDHWIGVAEDAADDALFDVLQDETRPLPGNITHAMRRIGRCAFFEGQLAGRTIEIFKRDGNDPRLSIAFVTAMRAAFAIRLERGLAMADANHSERPS